MFDIVSICIDRFRLDQKPPFPFFPSRKKRALSPFSLITYQVKSTYQNSKYILKRNQSLHRCVHVVKIHNISTKLFDHDYYIIYHVVISKTITNPKHGFKTIFKKIKVV